MQIVDGDARAQVWVGTRLACWRLRLAIADFPWRLNRNLFIRFLEESVAARSQNQHARRVRYPEHCANSLCNCDVNTTTRGILLRKRKLSDTSLIVSWCTDSLGLIQTVARGARRPGSPFLGRLDLFFEAEVSIARSRKSNLHTLREVALVNAFPGIRNDHRRMQAAAYFVELIEVCTETEHHEPEIFRLLQRAFGYLNEHDPDERAVVHFESELARITGVHDRKASAAMALGHLFGKLPSSRTALLKLLRDDKDD